MSYTPGRFVWFEHRSNDIPKARAFYEKLFDWNTEMMAIPGSDSYPVIHNGDNGIGGYAQAPAGTPTRWLSYLSVSDVDSAYKAALGAGAKSLMAPMDYGSLAGRAATIADPTGGVLSLWRGAEGDPAESETTPPGGWIWNELATKDEKTALAFYEKAFGFSHDAMAMPDGTYYILKQGAKAPRRRVQGQGREDADAVDAVAACVAAADATSERAQSLGATVLLAPMDIPGVGRLALYNDPLGASIAILKPDPSMR